MNYKVKKEFLQLHLAALWKKQFIGYDTLCNVARNFWTQVVFLGCVDIEGRGVGLNTLLHVIGVFHLFFDYISVSLSVILFLQFYVFI